MERVKKGEKYWFINSFGEVVSKTESGVIDDAKRFEAGNYFATKEEAEAMAKKICKVLQGANVIEVPSKPLGLTDIKNNHLRGYVPERLSINDLKAFALGFWEGCDWLALKIVK